MRSPEEYIRAVMVFCFRSGMVEMKAQVSKRFLKLTDAMEKEQENNQSRMQEIAASISKEEHSEGDVQIFMGKSGVMLPLRSLTKRC